MRLSATERIMREAEHHDDVVEAANHGDTEKVSAAPFASLGFASPRLPPLEGFDVDVDVDMADDASDGDEEGETQVDAQRSADALKQMRALEATATASRALLNDPPASPAHGRGLPPGRPAISAIPLTASPTLARRLADEPAGVSTLKFPPMVGPAAIQPDPLPSDDRPEHLFSSSRLQFGSVASAPAQPSEWDAAVAVPRPRGVGRRMGVLIAISTAAAVALIAGAWTATQPETIPPVASGGTLTSRLTARVPKGTGPIPVAPPPTVGLVVATPPAPSPPEPVAAAADEPLVAPAEGSPAPQTGETDPAPVATAPAQPASAAPTSARSTVISKRAAAAAAKKVRLTRKAQAAANKRRLRAQRPAAKAASSAPPRPSAMRPAASARGGRGDPDDTLPPTD